MKEYNYDNIIEGGALQWQNAAELLEGEGDESCFYWDGSCSEEDFWDMAKENISQRADLSGLWELCLKGAEPVVSPEDEQFITACKRLLPKPPRNKDNSKGIGLCFRIRDGH